MSSNINKMNLAILVSQVYRILVRPFVILLFPFMFTSCSKDWLDKKPSAKLAVPTTLNDFQALLDNESIMNSGNVALTEIAADDHYMEDADVNSRGNVERNAYTWSRENPYENVSDWANAYKRVFYCNVILDGLSGVPISIENEQMYNQVKGQALFMRAMTFYQIAQTWAPPFTSAADNNELGIPLRLSSDINSISQRSTLKETYDRILKDLVESIELLPEFPIYKTRASGTAAQALLARIYLSIGNYEDALKSATACLDRYDTLLDYSSISAGVSAPPFMRFNAEVILHSTMINYTSIGTRGFIESSFYNSYDMDDVRKKLFFRLSGSGVNFRGSYNGSTVNFNGIAIDEVFFIRSECFARMGNVREAMEDLNILMRKRWNNLVNYPLFEAGDADEALDIILKERRKELLFRGIRWADLRRLNRDDRYAIVLTRSVNGAVYTLEPDSYRYTFPIPNDIIQQTGMQQNKGWDR